MTLRGLQSVILAGIAAFIVVAGCRGGAGEAPPVAPEGRDGGPADDAVTDSSPATGQDTAAGARDTSPEATYDPLSPILPILLIDVHHAAIVKDIKTPGALKVIEQHDGTHRNLAKLPIALETPIGIEYHGYGSLVSCKKGYGVELQDGSGMDRKFPLLGMPSESDWVLYGCFGDLTCMRDALVYAIGRGLGRYNPRTRFVEVFLDGAYQGLYLVIEKIKVGKDRVPLPKPAPDDDATGIIGATSRSR